MVGYRQTNQKTDTGKTLTRWPVFVDHFSVSFNNAKESKEASRRVELRMQFFGLKDKRDGDETVDFPPVINKEVCQLVMPQ
ncbi:hypothetical protein H6218_002870 [Cronobacter sakazakii]|nr:hypothetical protein [Cronobacter sakazakii]